MGRTINSEELSARAETLHKKLSKWFETVPNCIKIMTTPKPSAKEQNLSIKHFIDAVF